MLFFAGHGEKIERQAPDPTQPGKTYTHRTGYLIPLDGPKDQPGEWIKLDAFLDELATLPARHIFVILDACKSGIALAEKFKVKGGEQPTSVTTLRRFPSRRVMTSARYDEKAAEGGSGTGHSVFAEALISAIQARQADRDGDGYIKTIDLFSFVQDSVSKRAKTLFGLRQTPDYGYLSGDGSGDLVISLHEGPFNRLVEEALGAMLRHDVPRLEKMVNQLLAANAEYPLTLYLQFRLKFMQGDLSMALQLVSRLRDLHLPPGTLPLSETDLVALSVQLRYWEPLLSLLPAALPMKTVILTAKESAELHEAPLVPCAAGNAYQVENEAVAQFQVTNLSDEPVYLYYISVVPTGRLVIGPLLDPVYVDVQGLGPNGCGQGRPFHIRGLPGSVTKTRILSSPGMLWDVFAPPTVASRSARNQISLPYQMQMQTIWYQIVEDGADRATSVQSILSAFVW